MDRLTKLQRSARSGATPRGGSRAAVIACAAVLGALGAVATGCFDTVSLGSGEGGAGGGGKEVRPWKTRFQAPKPPDEEVTVGGNTCLPGLTTDLDHDGFTASEGDCNDCDPDMGPSAVEMPTVPGETAKDEDCDGAIDEGGDECDAGLSVNDPNALSAARAVDLCAAADGGRWGVMKAVWVMPDGSTPPMGNPFALGHGLVDRFGPNVAVRHGHRMLALSSGTARQPTDPDYEDPRGFDKLITSKPIEGFPPPSAACPDVGMGDPHDGVALELVVRAPQNAEAVAFDFNFYTYEVPERACSPFGDAFAALLSTSTSEPGLANIAFDGGGNAVGVNSVLFEACSCAGGAPCWMGGQQHTCSLGAAPLAGTGYGADLSKQGDHGATGWLTTAAPVERGGTLTLRLAIQDAGDGQQDSTVLVDHFRWHRMADQIPRAHLVREEE